jgi:cytochrome P450
MMVLFGLPMEASCDRRNFRRGLPQFPGKVIFWAQTNWPQRPPNQALVNNLAMAAYFQRLFELRRREPGNDLTTHLVQAEEDGESSQTRN